MPRLPWLAPTLAALLCAACFKDLGTGDTDPPSTTTSSTDPDTGYTATSAATESHGLTSDSADDADDSDPSDPSDPSSSDSAGTDPAPACGDGIVDPGEGCDDGSDNAAANPCTPACQPNICGDGYKADSEYCDDANLIDADGCNAVCVTEKCGDGLVAPPLETCEDGNENEGDGCTSCHLDFLFVFVTAAQYDGNLMGPTLADQTCADEAAMAGLNGSFLAWLSTPEFTPKTRFNPGTLGYVLPGASSIAESFTALTTVGPTAPIDRLADGKPLPPDGEFCDSLVWTGTETTGDIAPYHCAAFTSNKLENTGLAGNYSATDSTWTAACPSTCNQPARLYCFQQVPVVARVLAHIPRLAPPPPE
jgi:cysteine-rich repeat protein